MARKLFTIVLASAFLMASFVATPVAALQAYPHWEGGFWTYPTFSYKVTGADGPNPMLSFKGDPRYFCEAGGGLHTYANVTGPVTITIDFSGTVAGPAFFHLWSWKSSTGPDLLLDESIEGSFSFVRSITMDVETGELIEIYFNIGGCVPIQGTLDLNLDWKDPPLPESQYTMWLLTRNDGTACLLKSDTHPSVQVQKAYCFPEATNQSWVADNVVCSGRVDENDFWSCAAAYGAWLGLSK